ncbi:E3 ubiquitin-protein ligase DTX3L1 isoform 4-T6 [Spinachia spinachia]
MGSGQSTDKLHCNRYLDGKGPPPLSRQATDDLNGRNRGLNDWQPEGQMTWVILPRDLPGFPKDKTLQINYVFPDGIQTVRWTNTPTLASRMPGCSALLTCLTTGTAGSFSSFWTRPSASSSSLRFPPIATDRTPSLQLPSPLKPKRTKALTAIQTLTT